MYRITPEKWKEQSPQEQRITSSSNPGDINGYYWIPNIGKKAGKYFLCKIDHDTVHQYLHCMCPMIPGDLSFEQMVYLRNLFWEPAHMVMEQIPTIAEYGAARTNARTLFRIIGRPMPRQAAQQSNTIIYPG